MKQASFLTVDILNGCRRADPALRAQPVGPNAVETNRLSTILFQLTASQPAIPTKEET